LIETQVQTNGGDYRPDLSRECTHLICALAEGKKYEAALKWGINCIGIEWLDQSIERGMSLDPKYFTLNIEPSKRGEGAWNKALAVRSSDQLGLLGMSMDTEVPMGFDNGLRKRRLRRAGSQIAQDGIWEGILGGVNDTFNTEASMSMPIGEGKSSLPQQVPLVEDSSRAQMDMDFDGFVKPPFEGMVFYAWGFTDKKVYYL
jgi:DNA replication regulator DPB11